MQGRRSGLRRRIVRTRRTNRQRSRMVRSIGGGEMGTAKRRMRRKSRRSRRRSRMVRSIGG
eukprot:4420066-Pyramimonas_sp.AAC.1